MSTTKTLSARNLQDRTTDYSTNNVKWLSVFFLSVYFVSLWNPPLPIPTMSWPILIGLATYSYLIQKKSLNMHAARMFWIVFGINILGAIVSLLRAPNYNQAVHNTVALVVNFVAYLLFLPLVGMQQTRRALLIVLLGVGGLWFVKILTFANSQQVLGLGSFGELGADKNHVGFCLALVSSASLYLSIFLELPDTPPPRRLVYRGFLLFLALVSVYSLTLIYARSALMTAILGASIVVSILFIKRGGKAHWWQGLILIGIITGAVILALPRILDTSPEWNRIGNIKDQGIERAIYTYDIRNLLIKKGLYLINQNPLLGVGVGGSRAAVSSPTQNYPYFLIHNSYLTEWAEKGILGIVSHVIWVIVYVHVLKQYFFKAPIYDQVWLLLFIPLFFDMNFLDMNSINMMMLLILAGMVYENESVNKNERQQGRIRMIKGV